MLARKVSTAILATGLMVASSVVGATVTLTPYLPSSTTTTAGANATFVRIDNAWQGSQIVWKDPNPIGTYDWGTGLWGIDDFDRILSGEVASVALWSGLVSTINFGDDCYNGQWQETWGGAQKAPLFSTTVGCGGYDPFPALQGNEQDNWISYFTGFIRIEQDGEYDFSVLNDDGFFFSLYGGSGQTQSISRDFLNDRDRSGFTQNLALSAGLYRFELGAYDRLEAGVVDLAWIMPGQTDWELIPTQNLAAIPEPGTLGLLAAGLMVVGFASRRHARAHGAAAEKHAA